MTLMAGCETRDLPLSPSAHWTDRRSAADQTLVMVSQLVMVAADLLVTTPLLYLSP